MIFHISKTRNIEIKGGIFEYLRNQHKTNLILTDGSPEENKPNRKKEYTYDGDPETIWVSEINNSFNQYISFSISKIKLIISGYSILYTQSCCPLTWEFQTSLDNISWSSADLVSSSILTNKLVNQFAIQPSFARFVRFVNKGLNNICKDSRFHLSEVDIYGSFCNYFSCSDTKISIIIFSYIF